jgi:hypothetical protein
MSTIYVLIAVLAFNGRLADISQEFISKEACEVAKESIRQKTSDGRYILLTCEKK